MTLPNELVVLIQLIVAYLVFNGLKGLGEFFGIDFSPLVSTVTAIIAGTVVFFFNSILAAIPPGQTQQIIAAILQLLVLLVGGIAGSTRVRSPWAFVNARKSRLGLKESFAEVEELDSKARTKSK